MLGTVTKGPHLSPAVAQRRRRLRRLLSDLAPTEQELDHFLAEEQTDERLGWWEDDDYLDDDVIGDFVDSRRRLAAVRVAAGGGGHGDLDATESARRWAMSLADAWEASEYPPIVEWRARWLRGETVPWGEMLATLTNMAEVGRALDTQRWLRLITPGLTDQPGWTYPRVRIDGSEALEELEQVAEEAAGRWWWTLEQAVVFVVSGVPPLTWTLRTETRRRSPGRPRVVLVIDPAVPVEHVIRSYIDARAPFIRRGRPVATETWEAVAWRLGHLDEPLGESVRRWLRRKGVEVDAEAVNAWKRKVKAALARLGIEED